MLGPIARLEPLAVQGDVPLARWLQRRVNAPSATDELVKTECKESTPLVVRGLIREEQKPPQVVFAPSCFTTTRFSKILRRLLNILRLLDAHQLSV